MARNSAGWGFLLATLAHALGASAAGDAKAADAKPADALAAGAKPAEAKPPEPELRTTIAVHGFGEVSVKNAYITPRGLVVHSRGLAIQPTAGAVLTVSPASRVLTGVSLVAGIWSDLDTRQR